MKNVDIFQAELKKLIAYQLKENDLSLAECVGVLEIEKHDLIAYAIECGKQEDDK